jgi:aminopeptidase N
MWIHEGFGTYMQVLYVERLHGKKGLRRELANQRRGVGNRVPVAPREVQDSKQIYFGGGGGNDIYNKGSLVLHTLRWHMGDEDFFKALRTFSYPDEAHEEATDGSQVRLVDTDDFRELCEQIEGEDLAWFFDVFVHQPKLPRLEVIHEGEKLWLRWDLPIEVDFPLEVPVRVKAGGEVLRLGPTSEDTPHLVGAGEIEVDPDLWILCELER